MCKQGILLVMSTSSHGKFNHSVRITVKCFGISFDPEENYYQYDIENALARLAISYGLISPIQQITLLTLAHLFKHQTTLELLSSVNELRDVII